MSKFDHLILLVGTNPLPNAVIGKLLAESDTTISLVFSDKTSTMTNNLVKWFWNQGIQKQQIKKCKKIIESDPSSIFDNVIEQLDKVKGSRLALGYSGGTKVMAVHAYRAVERWATENDIEAQFIYLDANSLCLQFEPLCPEDGNPIRKEYVGRAVEIELDDMLALHGWRLNAEHAPCSTPILPNTAHELAHIFSKYSLDDKENPNPWKEWWKNQQDNWKQNKRFDLPVEDILSDVSKTLRQELGLENDAQFFSWDHLQSSGFSSSDAARKWVDGTWLEYHSLDVLKQLAPKLYIQECAQSVKTAGYEFEEDLVAIRGYQLYVFTITTGRKRADVKKRLFGAYVHARQLGGDEARVALICVADDPDSLRDEIRRDFDQDGRIAVFGRKHLADLQTHISKWIQEQSKEENTRCNKSYL